MFVSMGRNAVAEFVWTSKRTETTVENAEMCVYPAITVSLACVAMISDCLYGCINLLLQYQ